MTETLRITSRIARAEQLVASWWRGNRTATELEVALLCEDFHSVTFHPTGSPVSAVLNGVRIPLGERK
jgi:hypothetical protein